MPAPTVTHYVIRKGNSADRDRAPAEAELLEAELPTSTWSGNSCYVFALHKSGSTLLNKMLAMIGRFNGSPRVSIEHTLRSEFGLEWTRQVKVNPGLFPTRGYMLGGYRSMPPQHLPRLEETRKVLLVRDPRDILTSLYFSVAYSHVGPQNESLATNFDANRERAQDTNIDDFVLEWLPRIKSEINRYLNRLPRENLRVYHYEDVIFRKREWLEDMLAFVGIDCESKWINAVLKAHDVVPDKEQPDKHIRSVVPGDHRRKLSPKTIRILDRRLTSYAELEPFRSPIRESRNVA